MSYHIGAKKWSGHGLACLGGSYGLVKERQWQTQHCCDSRRQIEQNGTILIINKPSILNVCADYIR